MTFSVLSFARKNSTSTASWMLHHTWSMPRVVLQARRPRCAVTDFVNLDNAWISSELLHRYWLSSWLEDAIVHCLWLAKVVWCAPIHSWLVYHYSRWPDQIMRIIASWLYNLLYRFSYRASESCHCQLAKQSIVSSRDRSTIVVSYQLSMPVLPRANCYLWLNWEVMAIVGDNFVTMSEIQWYLFCTKRTRK